MLQNDENLKTKIQLIFKTQILLSLIWVKKAGGYSISVDSVVETDNNIIITVKTLILNLERWFHK
jgi:hypothetical protein